MSRRRLEPRSLTGDPITDRLAVVAQQLVGAVTDADPERIDMAFAAAAEIVDGRADPAKALAVVLAAMVPDTERASSLLGWWGYRAEYERLVAAGVDARIARELTGTSRGTAA